jgi:hypothetical protein
MGRKPKLDPGTQRQVVLTLLRQEESCDELAARYGVSEQTLYRLRKVF